MTKRPQR